MTTTKLGLHVSTGSRNGYGSVAAAGPAVVVSMTAGAFDELPDATVKIYRDITMWLDTPAGYTSLTPAEVYTQARGAWSTALAAKYQPVKDRYANVYFQPTNEAAANTELEYQRNIELERGFVDGLTAKGFKLCVGSLSGGDPDYQLWLDYYLPFLKYVASLDAGHIYGRHAYGGVPAGAPNMLTANELPSGNNPARPFLEAFELWAAGVRIPLYITEAGQNGGFMFPGVTSFGADVTAYDALCVDTPNIGGFCCWTYGDFRGQAANIEQASQWLTSYLVGKEIAPVELPAEVEPPPPSPSFRAIVVKVPQEATVATWVQSVTTFFQNRHTITASHDDMLTILKGGNKDSYVKMVHPWEPSQKEAAAVATAAGYQVVNVDIGDGATPPTLPPFSFKFWPTRFKGINQPFGANPAYYQQFGLPGHEGIDVQATTGSPIYAVTSGTVYRVEKTDNSNYGLQVRIDHGGGFKSVYAHLESVGVVVGQIIPAGQQIGKADSTGNSSGSHLHFTLKFDGATDKGLTKYPYDIIDPTPYLLPSLPIPNIPNPEPKPTRLDLAAFMFPSPGKQYIMRNNGGSQERYYPRPYKDGHIIQKGTQGEFYKVDSTFIYLMWDTSPEKDSKGTRRYYVRSGANGAAAPYIPRYMFVGESWRDNGHYVQFYSWDGCKPISENSGQAGQSSALLTLYNTFEIEPGYSVGRTIKIKAGAEWHWFTEGIGRVGWMNEDGDDAWKTKEDVSSQTPEPLIMPGCF